MEETMKKLLLALVVPGMLAFADRPFGAEFFQNGPYYAQPSWDQQLPPATRFIVLSNWNNEAVLDRETGVVWERTPNAGTFIWSLAIQQCTGVVTGGRAGWRLAAVQELQSLLDPSQRNPALPAGHPFQGVGADDVFWTATTYEVDTKEAYFAGISDAVDVGAAAKDGNSLFFRYWCVRGGSSVSNPP
jgi:hypothetical protein